MGPHQTPDDILKPFEYQGPCKRTHDDTHFTEKAEYYRCNKVIDEHCVLCNAPKFCRAFL